MQEKSKPNYIIPNNVDVAIFDVDNTLAKCNIVNFYLFIQKKRKNRFLWLWYFISFVVRAPYFIVLDLVSRDLFNRLFVERKFRKFQYKELETYAELFFNEFLKHRMIASTHDLIKYLQSKNVPIVLISTNFDLIVKQFGKYFDVPYICLKILPTASGVTIDFSNLDNFKENAVKEYSANSIGVGDSKYDIPVLNYVDYPYVVADKPQKWFKYLKKTPVLLDIKIKKQMTGETL
ncbi:haloacid dehalogenase-like hydrolase [Paenibacillus alkaliterrae]|uniref:HAD family hydrolase n=1 Tax=Paenibacillus alkaliterrae TaxID=320909 RepID=UPI001F2D4BE9|nr:HAD family hydrolase [Paenibacillus alkaliterrae]MCF2940617.1 haloacid dehalogenase-like hydrolase [Paenibacillus alkaliterrae]